MKRIKTYLSIIDSRLLNHIKGKPGEFIQLLKSKEYLNEQALIADYQGSEDSYHKTKAQLLNFLQAFAVIGNSRGANPLKKKLDLCRKKFLLARKFIEGGERVEGLRLAKEAYTIAVEYDFTHLACDLSTIVYHNHIYYQPSVRKAEYYSDVVKEHARNYMHEIEAEDYFFKSILKKPSLEFLKEAIDNIQPKTAKSHFYKSRLELTYHFKLFNYSDIIKACDSVLAILKDKKGAYSSWLSVFTSSKGIALMATGQHQMANETFLQASNYAPPKTFNDYLLRLYRTINFLHSGNYQEAYNLYLENKRCRFEPIQQQFAIIEGYMCFLSHYGKVKLKKTFRVGKYLNENILTHNQKQGDNISILIAELLIHLARDRGKFIDRIEAIKNYSYRNLKDKDTQRAKRFIKILCALPAVNFHPLALQRRTQRHFTYLKEQPVFIGHNAGIIEIIPFDNLLNMIVSNLRRKAV